jgi:hypothetical protein
MLFPAILVLRFCNAVGGTRSLTAAQTGEATVTLRAGAAESVLRFV